MLSGLRFSPLVLALSTCVLAADSADNLSMKLLTPELAQKILGGPVEAGKKNSGADIKNGGTVLSQCSYSMKDDAVTPTSVSLILRRAGTAEETKAIFLASTKTYTGQDVGGLGDAAYRTAAPAQLNVLKGHNWLIVSAGAFPKADPMLQEKAAREILKNIQD